MKLCDTFLQYNQISMLNFSIEKFSLFCLNKIFLLSDYDCVHCKRKTLRIRIIGPVLKSATFCNLVQKLQFLCLPDQKFSNDVIRRKCLVFYFYPSFIFIKHETALCVPLIIDIVMRCVSTQYIMLVTRNLSLLNGKDSNADWLMVNSFF